LATFRLSRRPSNSLKRWQRSSAVTISERPRVERAEGKVGERPPRVSRKR
jgi:hypothetical protein